MNTPTNTGTAADVGLPSGACSASSIPKGFRTLRLGETLKRGDKFFDFDKWTTTAYPPGTPITRQILRANGNYIRREPNVLDQPTPGGAAAKRKESSNEN